MHRLGISVYPEHSTAEKDLAYMKLAAKYGFSRIFTCFLSAKEEKKDLVHTFSQFVKQAHDLGFVVAGDVNGDVFQRLELSPSDIDIFHEIGLDILRLDSPFSEADYIRMTNNPYGIQIEFNTSALQALDLILDKGGNRSQMTLCHNFYPQEYTGLSWDRFMEFNRFYSHLGLPLAAFVSSNEKNTFGPWPVSAGLPTVEIHRGLPIDFQARHLLACREIDDIIIGNAFASEEELASLGSLDLAQPGMKVSCEEGLSSVEEEIAFHRVHWDRQDASDFILRSSAPRVEFGNTSIPVRPVEDAEFQVGDVLIVNDNLAHYRGELEIVKKPIRNTGERNRIGHISDREQLILGLLRPQNLFRLEKEGK